MLNNLISSNYGECMSVGADYLRCDTRHSDLMPCDPRPWHSHLRDYYVGCYSGLLARSQDQKKLHIMRSLAERFEYAFFGFYEFETSRAGEIRLVLSTIGL